MGSKVVSCWLLDCQQTLALPVLACFTCNTLWIWKNALLYTGALPSCSSMNVSMHFLQFAACVGLHGLQQNPANWVQLLDQLRSTLCCSPSDYSPAQDCLCVMYHAYWCRCQSWCQPLTFTWLSLTISSTSKGVADLVSRRMPPRCGHFCTSFLQRIWVGFCLLYCNLLYQVCFKCMTSGIVMYNMSIMWNTFHCQQYQYEVSGTVCWSHWLA